MQGLFDPILSVMSDERHLAFAIFPAPLATTDDLKPFPFYALSPLGEILRPLVGMSRPRKIVPILFCVRCIAGPHKVLRRVRMANAPDQWAATVCVCKIRSAWTFAHLQLPYYYCLNRNEIIFDRMNRIHRIKKPIRV